MLRRALDAASRAIDRLDPAREGSIAAPIGLAISRLAAEWTHDRAPDPARAARVLPAGEPFRDWTASLDPWQSELTLDPRIRTVLDDLTPRSRDVICLRHGLAGEGEGETFPRTLPETAAAIGTSVVHVARFERAAVREALALAR